MNKHTRGGGRLAGATALLIVAGFSSSCTSMQEYEDAVALAKEYQTENYDLALQNERLRKDYETLQAQFRDEGISQISANLTDAAYAKLSELERQMAEREKQGPVKDVERYQLSDGYVYMIQDRLLFESGKAELGKAGKEALTEISSEIAAQSHGTIWVRGHTDSDPVKKEATLKRFPHGNLQLSAERAVAVGAMLIGSKAIGSSEVRVMGFGPHEPVAPNNSAENKRLNRRVEIFVSNPE